MDASTTTARVPERVNLRDALIFPTFNDCPDEYSANNPYYDVDWRIATARPKVHWCFFGEVVETGWFVRFHLIVKDKSGKRTNIWFHTEDRGECYARTVQKGQTVAILYGQQHGFLDMSRGFRVEEHSTVKIIPCTLQALLAANDKLLQQQLRVCWQNGCEQTENLMKCSTCHQAGYCGKDHQAAAWKGHKAECKVFAASNWFMNRDWEHFHGFWDFGSWDL